MTLVSVVIPAFNAERFLEKAIESALAQSYTNLEIIVVNDSSTDQTRNILTNLSRKYDQINAIDNDRNRGSAYSRNVGIEAAIGDWIALLDADDWWDQRRLAILLDVAERNSADIVADNVFFVGDSIRTPWHTLIPRKSFSSMAISVDEYLKNDMPGNFGTWGILKPIFKKKFLYENGIRYKEELRRQQDTAFLIECLYHKPAFLICLEPLYNYRMHEDSSSLTLRVPDLLMSQEANQHYLAKFRNEGAKSTCDLMTRRISRLEKFIRYRRVIEPIKGGDWAIAAKQIAGDVGIMGYVGRMLGKFAIRAIRRKFFQIFPRRDRDTPSSEGS